MRGEGRIIDGPDVHLAEWRPDEFLPVVGHDAARYSRGYLAADPAAWFPALADHWLPLSHVLTSSLTFRSCERVFELPETLECPVIFEVDSELAVIAFERDAGSIIAQTLLPGCGPSAAAVALDYIQRRLLSSLSRSWSGSEGLVARYLSSGDWSGVDVA
ncbi:MAG TPA: hypothetical protein PLP17_13910, partial [Oligoflexia bacterium]|nr:hypothetical protein [Oligoflexia bacterium]